jgi:hypothetical protein
MEMLSSMATADDMEPGIMAQTGNRSHPKAGTHPLCPGRGEPLRYRHGFAALASRAAATANWPFGPAAMTQ